MGVNFPPLSEAGKHLLYILKVLRKPEQSKKLSDLLALKRSLLRFLIQMGLATLIGWVLANDWATHPYRASWTQFYWHSDWALQTTDLSINLMIIAAIVLGQLLLFATRACKKFSDFSYGFLVGLILFALTLFALYKRTVNLKIAYTVSIETVLQFSLIWIFISIILFLGTDKRPKAKNKQTKKN